MYPNQTVEMLQIKKTFSGIWPSTEDNLKILKGEYFGSYWLDPTQISKISLLTELNSNGRWPKILKVEDLIFHRGISYPK
jgi:hypothetical protein